LVKNRKTLLDNNKIVQNKIKYFADKKDIEFFAKLFSNLVDFIFIIKV